MSFDCVKRGQIIKKCIFETSDTRPPHGRQAGFCVVRCCVNALFKGKTRRFAHKKACEIVHENKKTFVWDRTQKALDFKE